MKQRIHIFGASGSGTTTIAQAVCEKLAYTHFDSDNYFWLHTEDPFTIERDKHECFALMNYDLSNHEKWILSGSLVGWGDEFIPFFDLVVFVYVPKDIRMERITKREYERYGNEMRPGGRKYNASTAFLEWAASYDAGTHNGRSLPKHEKWLREISCTTLRVVNISLEDSIDSVCHAIQKG